MTSYSDSAERDAGGAGGADTSSAGSQGIWSCSGWYIAATVAASILFWPLGVALLAWAFWHRQVKASSWWQSLRSIRTPTMDDLSGFVRRRPSNEALAEYLAREQQRMREEQQRMDELVQAFEAFKAAERKASDQRDFENFLRSRETGAS